MLLSCGSRDPSREEISKGFVLPWRNVVWGLVGFNRALLALPFFSYCRVELGVLAGKAHMASCCSTGDGPFGSRLGFWVHAEVSHAWARDHPEPCSSWPRGRVKQRRYRRIASHSFIFFPYFPSKASEAGHCSFPLLVPACRRCCLHKCTLSGIKQTSAVPHQWRVCAQSALELVIAMGGGKVCVCCPDGVVRAATVVL